MPSLAVPPLSRRSKKATEGRLLDTFCITFEIVVDMTILQIAGIGWDGIEIFRLWRVESDLKAIAFVAAGDGMGWDGMVGSSGRKQLGRA